MAPGPVGVAEADLDLAGPSELGALRFGPDLDAARYLNNIVFTTGIVDDGETYLVASGEDDIACRLTRIPKSRFFRVRPPPAK